jgi:hypothetical protein
MECCRPFLSQELNRARLLPISKTVALPEASRNRKRYSGVAVSRRPAFLSGAPRKSHTWETRHLAGPIRGVGSAGRRESVSAVLRTYGVGEA